MLLYLLNGVVLVLCAVALVVNKPELNEAALITAIVCSSLSIVGAVIMYLCGKWDND